MYIDADTIIKAASLLAALGALVGAVIAVYKVFEVNKKQSEVINEMWVLGGFAILRMRDGNFWGVGFQP